MPTPAMREDARLNFRLRHDLKDRIEKAAAVKGKSITEFAVAALADVAEEVLEQHQTMQLSDRDRDRFLALLDAPPPPNPALKRAAKTHRRLIVK
jgi:uncharacterized protein (DUF1778 family)